MKSRTVAAILLSASLTWACSGSGGSVAEVDVPEPGGPPVVTLAASPTSVTTGGTVTLSWGAANATGCTAADGWNGNKAVSGSEVTSALTATTSFTLTCSGAGGSNGRTVTVIVTELAAPTVSLTASPATVASGQTANLTWTSSNATNCTATGGWSGTRELSGTQATDAITATTSFTLTCTGAGGVASQTATISVGSTPAPTLALAASPSVVVVGNSTTLTWNSTNSTQCSASGDWSGNRATNGSETSDALSAATDFTLTCSGPGGSVSQTVAVSVTTPPAPPSVSLAASPATVASGSSSTLTWSSSNATSCTASGGWAGSKATNGSQSTGVLTANTTFTLACAGDGGSSSRSVTVTVTNPTPAPTVTIVASPTSVASGGSSSLTWSSTDATACTASGAWSGNRATAGSASTGALTSASNTFTLNCSGTGGTKSATAIVTVTDATGTKTGLNFPSNGDSPSNAFVAFQFLNPQNNGLPIWGPSGAGVTYIWRYRPRQQAGYYVTFWWSNNGRFLWDSGSSDSYYGAHPYPQGGGSSTVQHYWELAGMDTGSDWVATRAGSPLTVVKDVWYTQALRITVNGNGTKTAVFYINLPSTANGNVIEHTAIASWGERNPPSPALTFGDSPWYYEYQHERLSGVLRGIKIFNKALSEADMLAEAASDTLVTNDGQANVWYMNINPTPSDISDKSGAGHHPVWADPNNRASLWSE